MTSSPSLFERFIGKETPAMRFTLLWPTAKEAFTDEDGVEHPAVEPRLELTVDRIPPAEEMNIDMAVTNDVKTGAIGVEGVDAWTRYSLRCFHTALRLPRFATGWKALDGGPQHPFSKEAVGRFIQTLAIVDVRGLIELGAIYLRAVADDKKKFDSPASTETAS